MPPVGRSLKVCTEDAVTTRLRGTVMWGTSPDAWLTELRLPDIISAGGLHAL